MSTRQATASSGRCCARYSRFTGEGLDAETARELVIAMIAALEGAFVLARASRSTEALLVAGELIAGVTQRALSAR